MSFPNVRLSNRPLHFIYLCDCSGSMAAQGKIQALNQAIRQSLPGMAAVAQQNPEARVLVRAVSFADQASWHLAEPTQVQQLQWHDLKADGITAMGAALELVASALQSPPIPLCARIPWSSEGFEESRRGPAIPRTSQRSAYKMKEREMVLR